MRSGFARVPKRLEIGGLWNYIFDPVPALLFDMAPVRGDWSPANRGAQTFSICSYEK